MIRRALLIALTACLVGGPVLAQTRSVAVTFDDLPYQATGPELCDPEAALRLTRDFVDMLRPLDTRATGFVNEGQVCDANRADLLPALLTVWLDAGLDLGNHSFSHPSLHGTTAEAWLADVDRGAEITRPLLEARGMSLRWFRHPFLNAGETPEKKATADAGLAQRGYVIAPVTLNNDDWMFAALYRRAERDGDTVAMQRVGQAYVAYMATALDHWEPYSAALAGGREPAQVLLLHANTLNRDWYPAIHALFLARGYRFVSLETALADPIYALPDTYARPNGVSWLHRWTASSGGRIQWEPEPPQWIRDAYAGLN